MRRQYARQHETSWGFSLPVPSGLGELMAYFMIYGDESGKFKQHDYISFCGYVGHCSEWDRVSMEWNNVRFKWGVPALHMRCVMRPDGNGCNAWQEVKDRWGADWENKRDDMLLDFASSIRHATIAAVGTVIDSAHFKAMPDSKFKRNMKDPVFLGLHSLIMGALDKIDRIDKCQSVSLILDEDPEYAKSAYDVITLKSAFQRVHDRLSAVTFARDQNYGGLQMADFLAYESRKWMVERLKNPEAAPSNIFAHLTGRGVHVPKLWSAEFLDKAAQGNNEEGK